MERGAGAVRVGTSAGARRGGGETGELGKERTAGCPLGSERWRAPLDRRSRPERARDAQAGDGRWPDAETGPAGA